MTMETSSILASIAAHPDYTMLMIGPTEMSSEARCAVLCVFRSMSVAEQGEVSIFTFTKAFVKSTPRLSADFTDAAKRASENSDDQSFGIGLVFRTAEQDVLAELYFEKCRIVSAGFNVTAGDSFVIDTLTIIGKASKPWTFPTEG